MTALIPLNRRSISPQGTIYDDFHNMLDDFFGEGWQSGRNLMRDTFKIDVKEAENEYTVEAELPGIPKEQIDLSVNEQVLTISVQYDENVNEENKNYIHRERRRGSMSRNLRLADAQLDEIKAKLENGVLMVTIPKQDKTSRIRKIGIE